MLSERMTEALNRQINNEIHSAYLYLSMCMHATLGSKYLQKNSKLFALSFTALSMAYRRTA